MKQRLACAAVAILSLVASARGANWSVSRVNHLLLTPPGGATVQEMSGVTYLGPAGGAYRFLAAEQTKGELIQFDLTFNSDGGISAISNATVVDINGTLDFEGAAYTNPARNSAFLSEENNPGVREVNLATGQAFLPAVTIPAVFTANKRANRGFESLTRSLDETVMWTANEEALTVDGPVATAAAGTMVRLLKFDVAGSTVTAGSQYAYQVEPIHVTSTTGFEQSGLSDLTVMPDGALLALERSAAVSTPIFLNRIYEVNFAGATDVSVGALGNGLTGQSYTPVGKQLLFSGAVDASAGQNMEGLTLGPRLANGSWVLIGVVDDKPGDSDIWSANTIVAFTATANVTGDFDADGDGDGADLLRWQRGLGKTIGATLGEGDGDRDGDVDAADLIAWEGAFITPASSTAPEPAGLVVAALGVAALVSRRRASPRQSG